MNPSENSELIRKFWEGTTSRTEEEALLGCEKNSFIEKGDAAYFNYINKQREHGFAGENEILKVIAQKERKHRKILYFSLGIAASFLAFLTLYLVDISNNSESNFNNQFTSVTPDISFVNFGLEKSNHTLYINGCRSTTDYQTLMQMINPTCIQNISVTNNPKESGITGIQNGIIDLWLKGKPDEVFSVCEGTLYFYQDGEIKTISIDDECSPNLLVDCRELPLSEIVKMAPNRIKSIEYTTDPRNCDGPLNGEYIVLESK